MPSLHYSQVPGNVLNLEFRLSRAIGMLQTTEVLAYEITEFGIGGLLPVELYKELKNILKWSF